MDNKNEITETDLVEVAMPEVTSEENPESKTEAAGKKPERKKKQRTLPLTATVKTSRSSAGKKRKFRLTA